MAPNTVDLAHLRYFRSIAEHGSMTAAARALKVSQPTLSVAVQNLEERLGTTLLLRGRTGVSLTRTGQELLNHASEIFALLERAEERIVGLQTEEVGAFVIGCHESLGAYFLPGFMRAFLPNAPRIDISLWNGTSDGVLEAVLSRQVDFGMVVNPREHPDLVLVPLFTDAVDILIAADKRPADLTLEGARALIYEGPLVFAGRVSQCQELLHRFTGEGMSPKKILTCGDLELVKSLALGGLGVALLPRRVAAYGHPGKLIRLHNDLPIIPDIISLVYRADIHRTRAAMRLKDALVEHGRRLSAVESVEDAP
jgi:molybdate transport repressor ModE-like protein